MCPQCLSRYIVDQGHDLFQPYGSKLFLLEAGCKKVASNSNLCASKWKAWNRCLFSGGIKGGMGKFSPQLEALPSPTCPPPVRRKQMAKISHFRQIFRFLPPQNCIFSPSMPPTKKFLVPPLCLLYRGSSVSVLWMTPKQVGKVLKCIAVCSCDIKQTNKNKTKQNIDLAQSAPNSHFQEKLYFIKSQWCYF